MNCRRCGTTLMLVVYPPSVQHEEMIIPSYYEDHLLERVSLLELRISQMTEKMSQAFDLMLKQSKTIHADHLLIKSILDILESNGIVESEETFSHQISQRNSTRSIKTKRNRKIEEIIVRHNTPNADLFVHLIGEGAKLLEKNEEKQAFQMLERAALLSPENVPLFLYFAENLFRAEKFDAARKNLENAYKIEPTDPNVLLLLGALYADEGNTEKARRLLSLLANEPKTRAIVNYIWGMLAAFEENWSEALAAFKTSLKDTDVPELNYLIACCYFQLKMTDKARTFLSSATENDTDFADAWFMKCLSETDSKLAQAAMTNAQKANEAGAQCLKFLKGKKTDAPETALPFSHFKKERPRLLTKGSLRLVNFFKSSMFDSLN